ncbi:hypothetical protein VTN96DRAFT_8098 [Rasamsonia emersonii]
MLHGSSPLGENVNTKALGAGVDTCPSHRATNAQAKRFNSGRSQESRLKKAWEINIRAGVPGGSSLPSETLQAEVETASPAHIAQIRSLKCGPAPCQLQREAGGKLVRSLEEEAKLYGVIRA